MNRPTRALVLRRFAETGSIDLACSRTNVTRATHERWLATDRRYAAAYEETMRALQRPPDPDAGGTASLVTGDVLERELESLLAASALSTSASEENDENRARAIDSKGVSCPDAQQN